MNRKTSRKCLNKGFSGWCDRVQICLAYESHHFSYSPSNHSANTHSHHWSGSSEINVIHPQTECQKISMQGVSVVWIKPVNFCNFSVIPKCYFTDCVVICNGQCNQKSRGSNKVTYIKISRSWRFESISFLLLSSSNIFTSIQVFTNTHFSLVIFASELKWPQ